jgi:hypothetical protein
MLSYMLQGISGHSMIEIILDIIICYVISCFIILGSKLKVNSK